jgi:hypothetical protein
MFKKYFALSQLVCKSEERATWFSNLAPKEKQLKLIKNNKRIVGTDL